MLVIRHSKLYEAKITTLMWRRKPAQKNLNTGKSAMYMTRKTTKKMAMGLALGLSLAMPSYANTITLDGTSGDSMITGGYDTTGDLTLDLGFFTEYLIVAGGGGSGRARDRDGGSGGGAGGVLAGTTTIQPGILSVGVGAGGAGGSNDNGGRGLNGGNSAYAGLTAFGGGGGAGRENHNFRSASSGGSGGGGQHGGGGAAGTPGQGNKGGDEFDGTTDNHRAGGGGGGATQAGGNAAQAVGGKGGDGLLSDITGQALYYGGGGGAGTRSTSGTVGAGGLGGGGNGSNNGVGQAGVNGTGGGAGGSGGTSNRNGARGGTGVVIVRYAGDQAGTGGTITAGTGSAAGYTIHQFTHTSTSNQTYSFNLSGLDLNERLGATVTGQITGSGNLSFNGPGRLTLSGNNDYTGETTVSSGILVIDGMHTGGDAFTVAGGAAFGGGGSIGSALTLDEGANFWWDGVSILDVDNDFDVTLHSSFGVHSLIGFNWEDIALGEYLLIANNSDFSNISNWGFGSALEVGDGKYAYFSEGSLKLNVVPEPTAALLGGLGLLVLLRRRRRR